MASTIQMENPITGQITKGFYGFSWTTLLFGPFPALFRSDFMTFIGFFVIWAILAITTAGVGTIIASIAWAFMYNKYYTNNLIKKGFMLAGSRAEQELAASTLGSILTPQNSKQKYEMHNM